MPISDVYQTIQAYMGGLFVNYFNQFGRTWQVYVEAEAPYRSNTEKISASSTCATTRATWCPFPR